MKNVIFYLSDLVSPTKSTVESFDRCVKRNHFSHNTLSKSEQVENLISIGQPFCFYANWLLF